MRKALAGLLIASAILITGYAAFGPGCPDMPGGCPGISAQ